LIVFGLRVRRSETSCSSSGRNSARAAAESLVAERR
jgi:hypothetical protein